MSAWFADRDDCTLEEEPEETENVEEEKIKIASLATETVRYLIANRAGEHVGEIAVDRASREIVDTVDTGARTLKLLVSASLDGGLECPSCYNKKEKRTLPLFRHSRLAAPFLLNTILPTLLEYAPDSGDKPADLPWRGHRLLTFNDSRQGTARMTISLQQGAERTLMRGLIYHFALQHSTQGNASRDAVALEQEIATLESVNSPGLTEIIKEKKAKLAQLQRPQPLPFADLVEKLTNEAGSFPNIFAAYRELDPLFLIHRPGQGNWPGC